MPYRMLRNGGPTDDGIRQRVVRQCLYYEWIRGFLFLHFRTATWQEPDRGPPTRPVNREFFPALFFYHRDSRSFLPSRTCSLPFVRMIRWEPGSRLRGIEETPAHRALRVLPHGLRAEQACAPCSYLLHGFQFPVPPVQLQEEFVRRVIFPLYGFPIRVESHLRARESFHPSRRNRVWRSGYLNFREGRRCRCRDANS